MVLVYKIISMALWSIYKLGSYTIDKFTGINWSLRLKVSLKWGKKSLVHDPYPQNLRAELSTQKVLLIQPQLSITNLRKGNSQRKGKTTHFPINPS